FVQEHQPDFYRVQLWYCEPGTPVDRQRDTYGLKGHGYAWRHATMDHQEAMACVEDMFRTVRESAWLPQWSFDFWIIPYVLGRGITLTQFKTFMIQANTLLGLEF